MSPPPIQNPPDAEFDNFAGDYDALLNQGLALTGEKKDYFIEGRLHWLSRWMSGRGLPLEHGLDFGCGTGSATPYLQTILGLRQVTGIDPSDDSLVIASRACDAAVGVRFANTSDFDETGVYDLAYCNGVFHHIPVVERAAAVRQVFQALKPGGVFALWENNAWNPVTRYLMSKVPFDRDAILVWPSQARRLLTAAGFGIVRTDFLFIFPHALGFLRSLEKPLCKLPMGGQYLVLGRKPDAG